MRRPMSTFHLNLWAPQTRHPFFRNLQTRTSSIAFYTNALPCSSCRTRREEEKLCWLARASICVATAGRCVARLLFRHGDDDWRYKNPGFFCFRFPVFGFPRQLILLCGDHEDWRCRLCCSHITIIILVFSS